MRNEGYSDYIICTHFSIAFYAVDFSQLYFRPVSICFVGAGCAAAADACQSSGLGLFPAECSRSGWGSHKRPGEHLFPAGAGDGF